MLRVKLEIQVLLGLGVTAMRATRKQHGSKGDVLLLKVKRMRLSRKRPTDAPKCDDCRRSAERCKYEDVEVEGFESVDRGEAGGLMESTRPRKCGSKLECRERTATAPEVSRRECLPV